MKQQLTIPMPAFCSGQYPGHFIGICLVFMSACSAFKEKSFYQADSLLWFQSNREMKTNSISNSKVVHVYTSSNSVDKHYFTEIFPNGFFNYSPEKGFSGTADRVVLKGKIKEVRLVRDSGQLTKVSNLRTKSREQESSRIQTRSKGTTVKTKNTRLLVLISYVVLVGILIFMRYHHQLQAKILSLRRTANQYLKSHLLPCLIIGF